jgi:signal peptidase I
MNENARSLIKNIIHLGILIAIVLCIKGSVLGSYRIPSESMVPTLQIGDFIFVWNLSYGVKYPWAHKSTYQWSNPERGDIVVFRRNDDPSTEVDESADNIVKRVIGLPGESFEVRQTTVFINGQPLTQEPYAIWKDGGRLDGNFGPVTIPARHVIVLGDNRDQSKDSRFWNDPFLPFENIKGKAFFVYFQLTRFSRIGTILR